jgi:hypothetical protein
MVLDRLVPDSLLNVSLAWKCQKGEAWLLSTRAGIELGTFATEAYLEAWWQASQEQRGRRAHPLLTTPRLVSGRRNRQKCGGHPLKHDDGLSSSGGNLRDWDFD